MKTHVLMAMLVLLHVVMPHNSFADEGPKSNEQRVRDYVAAYNDRKLDTMLNMVTDDVEWLSVAGKTIAVESVSKADLRKGMEAYFKSIPSAKSELKWVQVTPARVATLEKATWQSKSGEKSQVSLAVYEFRDNLIARVYYYPAEK